MQQGFFDNRLEKKSCKPLDIQVFSTTKWKKNAPKWRLIILPQTVMNGVLIRAKRK
jgi:hypothetical protein